jgi:hypothetical protein
MRALAFSLLFGALLPAQQPPAAAPTVATHYFYWYRWPGEHFAEPGAPGREGHAHHFEAPQTVDYESPAWHAQNFAAMAACGIDAALPVYWGAPGAYERPGLAFSRRGLPAMVQALADLQARGGRGVRLGLFYDTSTLRNGVRGAEPAAAGADLTTDAGRALFCATVTDYFAAIPVDRWARHRGGALVVLYTSAFAGKWDRGLGGALRTAFAQRFPGERCCVCADASWGEIGQDLTTAWGAALQGPRLFPGVAQIGAGYDDRAVPGRSTPVREREDGAFYAFSWQQALRHRPELVLLETWNEMHEGTELCRTRELGDAYERATAQWVARLRAGDGPGAEIALHWPEPRARPDPDWGRGAAGAEVLRCDFAATPPVRFGLREKAWEDGPCEVADGALRAPAGRAHGYLYFQVSDHGPFDTDSPFALEIAFADLPAGATAPVVEFDSRDETATLHGSYTQCRAASTQRDGALLVARYELLRARFANRQNGGCDFRVVLPGGRGAVVRVELRPLPR